MLPYRGLGTGVPRALESWSKIEFIDDRDGCQFTSRVFREKIVQMKESMTINPVLNNSLSDLQLEILKLIGEDAKASYEEIAAKTDKDRATIRRNIQQLKASGVLERAGSRKTGYWKIIQEI